MSADCGKPQSALIVFCCAPHKWLKRFHEIPQGLKPCSLYALFGTTEVVP
jgi:hypothetical protein